MFLSKRVEDSAGAVGCVRLSFWSALLSLLKQVRTEFSEEGDKGDQVRRGDYIKRPRNGIVDREWERGMLWIKKIQQ